MSTTVADMPCIQGAEGCQARPWIRLDRNELAGAFGDIGTDLPLLVGMVLASGASGLQVFVVFGTLQILSALIYGIPMPVQPLKAVAALVIAQGIAAPVIFGAGLAIGVIMLILSLTGLLTLLARLVPVAVVRGMQLGLGLKLMQMAVLHYIPAHGAPGLWLAGAGMVLALLFRTNRRWPAALLVIGLGLVYGLSTGFHELVELVAASPGPLVSTGFGLGLVSPGEIWLGLLLLALPQIPLSLGNSILATAQLAEDWFPERRITVRRIGLTYALLNLMAAPLHGFPVCHGSGGMAGHYTFGGRTGGSVLFYGLLFIALGGLAGDRSGVLLLLFPLPMLGVLLLYEGAALAERCRDLRASPAAMATAGGVALAALLLPYGFLIGMTVGTLLGRENGRRGRGRGWEGER